MDGGARHSGGVAITFCHSVIAIRDQRYEYRTLGNCARCDERRERISRERERERSGAVSVPDAAAYALDVLRVMAQKPHLNVQLHDKLYHLVNVRTRTGEAVIAFYSLAVRTAQANIDPEWEKVNFESSGMVGPDVASSPWKRLSSFLPKLDPSHFPNGLGNLVH